MIKVNQQQKKKKKPTRSIENERKAYTLKDVVRVPVQLLCDPKYFWYLTALLLLGELVLNTFIIQKIACNKYSFKYLDNFLLIFFFRA